MHWNFVLDEGLSQFVSHQILVTQKWVAELCSCSLFTYRNVAFATEIHAIFVAKWKWKSCKMRFSDFLGQVSINAFKGKGRTSINNSLPSWYMMLTHLFFYAASRWKTPHGSFSLPSNKCWKLIFQPIHVSGTTECNFHKFITWYLLSCQ